MINLEGKIVAEKINDDVKKKVDSIKQEPHLRIILTTGEKDALVYTKTLIKQAEKVGINADYVEISSGDEMVSAIEDARISTGISGVIIQRPYPKGVDVSLVQELIPREKDVDGVGYLNMGLLFSGVDGLFPATALAVIRLLEHYDYNFRGKRAVVIGRSLAVGRPISMLLLHRHATVTICHSRTENLAGVVREGELVVVAVGKKHLITENMIGVGAWVVDCGFNYDETGGPYGDCDYDGVAEIAEAITPVPGGVGPITTAVLLENVLKAHLLVHCK